MSKSREKQAVEHILHQVGLAIEKTGSSYLDIDLENIADLILEELEECQK